ncbi:unnamed protein product [Closterium sp. NIES-54]
MVHQVLQRFGFQYSSPQLTPLSTSHSLSAPPLDESVEPSGPYPELVGCLMYLMTCTRPDLAYPLSLLARYVAPGRHRKVHWDAAKRVLRYLCSTSGMGLVLGGRGPVVLTGHADASWSCRPALPAALPCPACCVALPCLSRRSALPDASPCWLSCRPVAACRVALPCPRAALLVAVPPCPAYASPCCPHRPILRRPAARAARLLPALLRAALLVGALLPAHHPAGSHTAARTALPAPPCCCPPCYALPS